MRTPEDHIEHHAETLRTMMQPDNTLTQQKAMQWIFHSSEIQAYYKNAAIQQTTTTDQDGNLILLR